MPQKHEQTVCYSNFSLYYYSLEDVVMWQECNAVLCNAESHCMIKELAMLLMADLIFEYIQYVTAKFEINKNNFMLCIV